MVRSSLETNRPTKAQLYNRTGGFSGLETLLVLIIAATLVSIGYFVWQHRHQTRTDLQTRPTTKSIPATATTEPGSIPAAPPINNPSELNSALQALNQANIGANNTDNDSLSSNTAGF